MGCMVQYALDHSSASTVGMDMSLQKSKGRVRTAKAFQYHGRPHHSAVTRLRCTLRLSLQCCQYRLVAIISRAEAMRAWLPGVPVRVEEGVGADRSGASRSSLANELSLLLLLSPPHSTASSSSPSPSSFSSTHTFGGLLILLQSGPVLR